MGRLWHALHVALSGVEEGGEAPACWVVWTSPGARLASMSQAQFTHPPELVGEIAAWLAQVDFEAALRDLTAARELGVFVYALGPQGPSALESAELRALFEATARFYTAAASGLEAIEVVRC